MDNKTVLRELVKDFKAWSRTVKQEFEWETNYPGWSIINTVFEQLMKTTDIREWDEEFIKDVLYLIAKDNECECLADILHGFPECLLFLSRHGLNYPDSDARWQLVHHLSAIYNDFSESEEIINNYYQDNNEYVRRRALLALGYIKSKYAEENALKSWETGQEYQKIAALHVLYEIDSSKLRNLLINGETDTSELVKNNVKQIEEYLQK